MKNDTAIARRIAQLASRLDGDILTGLWILRSASPEYAPAYEQMGFLDLFSGGLEDAPQQQTPWHSVAASTPGAYLSAAAQALTEIMPQSPLPQRLLALPPLSRTGDSALGELISILSSIPPKDISLSQLYPQSAGSMLAPEDFDVPGGLIGLILSVVDVEPGKALYDPCYGSGSLLSRATSMLPGLAGLNLFGQAPDSASYQAGHVQAYLHGVPVDLGEGPMPALQEDLHPQREFPCILANPPFNQTGWYEGKPPEYNTRWQYGLPPRSNGNFAWLQHVVSHLSPKGRGAVILPNGTLTTQTQSEREIRIGLLKAGLVEAVIALPAGLFASTKIPCCIWLLAKGRSENASTLFVDAQQLRISEETGDDVLKLTGLICHHRQGLRIQKTSWYASASPEEIAARDYILSPNFYTLPPEIALEPLSRNLPKLHAQIDALLPLLPESLSALVEPWKQRSASKAWEKASLAQLYQISGGIVKKKEAFGHGTPMADVVTVIRNAFLPEVLPARVETDASELQKFGIRAGDILMNRSSENVEELACCCVAAQDQDAVFGGYLKRLRPSDARCPDSRYMAAYFRSEVYRREVRQVSPVYTTRSNMNMERLSRISAYYPGTEMQCALGETMLAVSQFREVCFDQELVSALDQFIQLLIEQFITYPILQTEQRS